ncbi:MAG: asparaginase [Candidatus Marinimicrobia bacterium]|nr:asparaginase [Candidatus Neomarinimicrobiota bacterium]
MKLLTKIYRGSVVESFHMGYAYAIDETGRELLTAGSPETPLFTQETAAPFKLATLLQEKGDETLKLNDKELAVACATHAGKDVHTDVIHSLLKKTEMTISDLQCEIQNPEDSSTFEKMIIQGRRPSQIHNVFSGLHAGMAALAKAMEEDPKDYVKAISHIHTKILENIKKYSECDKVLTEVDASGLDTYYLPMKNIVKMYNKLITGSDEEVTKVFQVFTEYPELIAGEGRFDTEFIKLLKGNGLVKSGSNGMVALCVKPPKSKAVSLVVKAIDGSTKAAVSMSLQILKHLELIDAKDIERLKEFCKPEFRDASGNITGHMETELILE